MTRTSDSGDPPDAATSGDEARVLLLMRDSRDRELLAETLAGRYAVEATADPERLAGTFDCCIFDLGQFEAVEGQLAERVPDEPSAFLPLVLLVADRDVASLPADHWALADDVISLPTHPEAIQARIGNLVERRLASLALAEERAALERQNERLEEFASIVSHDLRNPLSVAEGYVQLGLDDGEAELEVIDRSLGRMHEIIDDLLTLARGQADGAAFEPVELAAFLEECWLAVDTPEATLRVETDAAIRGQPGRLRKPLREPVPERRRARRRGRHDRGRPSRRWPLRRGRRPRHPGGPPGVRPRIGLLDRRRRDRAGAGHRPADRRGARLDGRGHGGVVGRGPPRVLGRRVRAAVAYPNGRQRSARSTTSTAAASPSA
ncbi:MAG: histidine kinase dimerization/phospho-acceptor domain-containing protein [Halobacteriales archaeon]|nr:histidine kinase dimerization/phospho-acceptor domain-containing protein [Halobacteriales archaeon]